jgi:hypothetical protein
MKILFLILFSLCVLSASSQVGKQNPKQKIDTVEASCGKCKFGLKGKTCDLAIRINGKAYYIDGASIDQFGDAHEDDGFCNAIRKAEVQGKLEGDKYQVTYMKVLPEPKRKPSIH